jgi:hypothetical protein
MNGTSGFQEVRSSTSRSLSSHFLHEQRHQSGKGSWRLLQTHELVVLFTGISTKRKRFLIPFEATQDMVRYVSGCESTRREGEQGSVQATIV